MQRQHVERLVEQGVALVEVHTQREELRLLVAGAETEDEAPTRQPVERRRRLGHEERVAVRRDGEVREQPETLGHRGRIRERDERVEGLMTARVQPSGAGDGMLGEGEAVPAGLLGGAGDHIDRPRVEHVALRPRGLRVLVDELHQRSPPMRRATRRTW